MPCILAVSSANYFEATEEISSSVFIIIMYESLFCEIKYFNKEMFRVDQLSYNRLPDFLQYLLQ